MKAWSERFAQVFTKTGRKLHAACPEIPAVDYLHTFMVGLLFLDASGFDVSERAAILSTSGKRQIADKEGLGTITEVGNSYKLVDLKASMIAQWSDYSIIERDKKRGVSHGGGKGLSSYTPHRRRSHAYAIEEEHFDDVEGGRRLQLRS